MYKITTNLNEIYPRKRGFPKAKSKNQLTTKFTKCKHKVHKGYTINPLCPLCLLSVLCG
jgi:hypothetical protein